MCSLLVIPTIYKVLDDVRAGLSSINLPPANPAYRPSRVGLELFSDVAVAIEIEHDDVRLQRRGFGHGRVRVGLGYVQAGGTLEGAGQQKGFRISFQPAYRCPLVRASTSSHR